jgi:hypothetical protein
LSAKHTSEHERMMEALFVGDAGAEAERMRLELAGCGTCSTRIAELAKVSNGLSLAGDSERADLVQADRMRDAPGSDRVIGTMRSVMAAESAPPVRATRIWPWLAAAGVLAALVFLLARERSPGRLTNEGTLGHGLKVELSRPDGQVDAYAPFEWTGEIQPDAHFVVEVLDPSSGDTHPIATQPTQEHEWSPPTAVTALWPHRIEWRIKVVAGGELQWTSPSKSAWLSR